MSLDGGSGCALPGGVSSDELRAAVAATRSWRGVLRYVGLTSPRYGRRFQRACDDLGIDYGHFRNRAFDDDQLRDVLATAESWPEALQRLGYAEESGSARATIRRHAVRLGLDVARLSAGPAPTSASPFAAPPEQARLREAGAYIVAAACALVGHKVSWPLEPAIYDLLVDTGPAGIQRVQVKTCTYQVSGSWVCRITRSEYADAPGGKRRVQYSPHEIDYFAIVDGDLAVYLIPVGVLDGLGTICVRKYARFEVPWRRRSPAENAEPSSGVSG